MVSALCANGERSYCLLLNGDAAELLNGELSYCLLINGDAAKPLNGGLICIIRTILSFPKSFLDSYDTRGKHTHNLFRV